jgi:AcrR family transcriptional regulator
MTTDAAFLRARRPEHKQQRLDAIIDAARRLAISGGVRAVTLTDIAAEVGLHKSALLRYFETREQILLEVTALAWADWAAGVRAGLDGAAASPAAASAALVADVIAGSFAARPLLCDLIPHTALEHERHVSPEAVRRYKRASLGAVADVAALTGRVLPALTAFECTEFVAVMASLAGALYQVATPPPALAALYATDPELAGACVDLLPRLRRAGEVFLAGLIPSRAAPPDG